MTLIRMLILMSFSSAISRFAGFILVTPVIAWMNYLADDGPIFPAPLVALAIVAPVSFILFIIQGCVIIFEWITKHRHGIFLLYLGVVGGLIAGLIPYLLVITPYQSSYNYLPVFAFSALGIIMGLIVFCFHWLANKVLFAIRS